MNLANQPGARAALSEAIGAAIDLLDHVAAGILQPGIFDSQAVSMIGNDMALDSGVGTCGKQGQSVPVGVGQPTLRLDGLTVGGTAA